MVTSDYLVPLVIGVTGLKTVHETDAQLLRLLSEVFTTLRTSFPDTPFTMLSPLAEGAGRLLARLGMEQLHARLVVPLPLPLKEYLEDFATAQSRQEFTELLRQADACFELPRQAHPTAAPGLGDVRRRQHTRLGAYIVEHCQILLALWDGQDAQGSDVTAQMVQWKSAGEVPEEFSALHEDRSMLHKPDTGIVWHINPVTYQAVSMPPAGQGSVSHGIFEKINAFNRDVKGHLSAYGEASFVQSQKYLLQDEETHIQDIAPRGFQKILPVYAAADGLSAYFQKQESRLVNLTYAAFFMAVFLYGSIDLKESLVIVHVVSILFMFVIVRRIKHKNLEDRFLDYRAFAEGLRVLAFWRLCGMEARVSAYYLSKHRGMLAWIRQAIRVIECTSAFAKTGHASVKDGVAFDLTKKLWVQGQLAFFSPRREKFSKWSGRLGYIAKVSFIATFCIAFAYFILICIGWTDKDDKRHSKFQAALGTTAAIGLAAEAYRKRRAFEALEKQYTLSHQLFSTAQERLMERQYAPEQIFILLGKEALVENGEWLWMHRSAPLEIPKG